MSAKKDESREWEIVFKYPGKTATHWQAVCSFIGTEREADAKAMELYVKDDRALDFMATPIEDRP